MMTDPIADMLTRIRNAAQARHANVRVPASKVKAKIAELLVAEGYLTAVSAAENSKHPALDIQLRYVDGESVFRKLTRESKPGLRLYVKSDEIPRVLGGFGTTIVSTSSGIMTGRQARKQGVGGELLLSVY